MEYSPFMNREQEIRLNNVSTHLENACKEILLGDEPLTRRVEIASMELELLRADDLDALPEGLQSEARQLIKLASNEITQDTAVQYASRLLDVYVKAENVH
jgi:hypothetical protein